MQKREFLFNLIITNYKLKHTVVTSFKHGEQHWDRNISIPLHDVSTDLNTWGGVIVKEGGTAR